MRHSLYERNIEKRGTAESYKGFRFVSIDIASDQDIGMQDTGSLQILQAS